MKATKKAKTKKKAVTKAPSKSPLVSIIMGSDSDWNAMKAASLILKDLKVPHETKVVSAHRTPKAMLDFAEGAAQRGVKVIIAGAGGAAHLPGMVASMTTLPVIGVPVRLAHLEGMDSLLSIVQMPKGVPVATMAIDNSTNAGLYAARILALNNDDLESRLSSFSRQQEAKVAKANRTLETKRK